MIGRILDAVGLVDVATTEDDARRRAHRISRTTMLLLVAGLAIGGGAAVLFGFGNARVHLVSTAILVAGATFVSASLVGFLFGMPRTLQGDAADKTKRTYQVNTNLEQISDWLTKIIVGVTLIQLGKIPGSLAALNVYIAPSLGGGRPGEVIAGATIVFFAAGGFFWGYLGTRLYVAGAIPWADDAGNLSTYMAAAKSAVERGVGEDRLEPGSDTGSKAAASDPAVRRLVGIADAADLMPSQLTLDQARTLALSYYFNERFGDAIPYFERANLDPGADPQFTMQHAIALGESARYERAALLLEMLARSQKGLPQVYRLLGYYLLWLPDRLQDAVRYGYQYLKSVNGDDGGALLNIACAYDQIADTAARKDDSAGAKQARDLAESELRRAIAAAPRIRHRAVELRHQKENFTAWGDNEFNNIVGR